MLLDLQEKLITNLLLGLMVQDFFKIDQNMTRVTGNDKVASFLTQREPMDGFFAPTKHDYLTLHPINSHIPCWFVEEHDRRIIH